MHYVDEMKKEIYSWIEKFEKEVEDKRILWDLIKMKIREYTIRYSKSQAKARKLYMGELQDEIQLEETLALNNDKNILEELELKRIELQRLYRNCLSGLKVISRANWYEETEINENILNNC